MNTPVDVLLLTGYLGAGKTTLLQQLLQLPEIARRQPALIINEFGELGVDGDWFDRDRYPLLEINRGSLFCICTKTDLLAAFQTLTEQRPGVVLIEATGVAETRDLESILDEPVLSRQFRVQADICVVDAVNFTQVAPFLRATRSQVAAADGLVINKVDLVPEHTVAALEQLLGQMNPRAPRVQATHGAVPREFLAQLQHVPTREALAIAQPESVHACSFTAQGAIDRAEFLQAVEQLGNRLLRLKGQVMFRDSQLPEFVESVCGVVSTRPAQPGTAGTAFTAIAFGLADRQLQRAFQFLA